MTRDEPQPPRCPIGKKEHQAIDKSGRPTGHQLCLHHFTRLASNLRGIETQIGKLSAAKSLAISYGVGGGGNSGSGSPAFTKAPARLDPIVLSDRRRGRGDDEEGDEETALGYSTDPVLPTLAFYADRIRSERPIAVRTISAEGRFVGMIGPACATLCEHPTCGEISRRVRITAPAPATVHSERDLLTRNLDYIATYWPDVAVFYSAIADLLGQLTAANGTAPPPPIGRCPAQPTPGVECGGPVRPAKPVHTTESKGKGNRSWRGAAPDALICSSCKTRWEGATEIARLAIIIEQQGYGG